MGKEYDGIHRLSFLINGNGIVETVFDKFKTKDHHEVVLSSL
jgi:peroxiredoxin Q/BCP